MHRAQARLALGILLLGSVMPAVGQQDRRDDNRDGNRRDEQYRANRQSYNNYYSGMNSRMGRGDYGHYVQQDEERHHHEGGGIGPGKAALIGGAGGAALGVIFGGGLKGSLIGGAAGAGIGAIGGKMAQGHDRNRDRHY